MIDCDKVLKNLYRLLEEDSATPLCVALKAHLQHCEACTRKHDELRGLIELCRSSPKARMPREHKEELKRFLIQALEKNRNSGT
jgi:predicted anti-sigma-YlaC factor YlaD